MSEGISPGAGEKAPGLKDPKTSKGAPETMKWHQKDTFKIYGRVPYPTPSGW